MFLILGSSQDERPPRTRWTTITVGKPTETEEKQPYDYQSSLGKGFFGSEFPMFDW